MLRELGRTRQIHGEPRRSWFIAEDLDLVVWFDASDEPCGFQFAYDKDWNEHSFSWHWQRGYQHYVVNGRGGFGGIDAPFLYANGPFCRDRVLSSFVKAAAEMPERIAGFVEQKLRDFSGPPGTCA